MLFYSALGMPVARFADRANRRNIVAIAFAFWSAMTALCGMAQSVTALALARIGERPPRSVALADDASVAVCDESGAISMERLATHLSIVTT